MPCPSKSLVDFATAGGGFDEMDEVGHRAAAAAAGGSKRAGKAELDETRTETHTLDELDALGFDPADGESQGELQERLRKKADEEAAKVKADQPNEAKHDFRLGDVGIGVVVRDAAEPGTEPEAVPPTLELQPDGSHALVLREGQHVEIQFPDAPSKQPAKKLPLPWRR